MFGHLRRAAAFVSLALSLVLLVGCSGGAGTLTGKVTAAGKTVTGGNLVFSPLEGGSKPASVNVGTDGMFSSKDVPVGKVRVIYNAPPADYPPGYTPKASEPAPISPFNGLVPKMSEVEIKAGAATLDIELVKPTK